MMDILGSTQYGLIYEFLCLMLVSSEYRTSNIHPRFDSQLEVCTDVNVRTRISSLVGTFTHPRLMYDDDS